MEFTVEMPDQAGRKIISAADFGVDPASKDNTEALNAAIRFCGTMENTTLIVPKGVYHFDHEDPVLMEGLHHFCFDGKGSEFIFTNIGFFRLRNCDHILIRGVIADWDWEKFRLASLMKIMSVSENGSFFDVEFPELESIKTDITFDNMNQYDNITLTPGTENGKEFWPGSLEIQKAENGDMPNHLRIFPKPGSFKGIQTGDIFLVRHSHRRGFGFLASDCVHLTFQDVTMYSSTSGCFMISGISHHVRLDGCVIGLRPGSNRRMSSDGDGVHVMQSKGYLIVENCDFSFMGDDDVNIHDTLGFICEKEDKRTLLLENNLPGETGDYLDIRRPDFSPVGTQIELAGRETVGKGCRLIFREDLPDEVNESYLLLNQKFESSHYIIRNNYFHHNRARGLLLQCSHGLVEGNFFEGIQGAAIYVMMETLRRLWYEGSGVDDLTVRNNRFVNCNRNDWTSAIDIMAIIPDIRSSFPIFTNIKFEFNLFEDFPSGAFFIRKARNITIRNNIFRNPTARKVNKQNRGLIYIEKSSEIDIADNTWESSPYVPFPGITVIDGPTDTGLYRANCDEMA